MIGNTITWKQSTRDCQEPSQKQTGSATVQLLSEGFFMASTNTIPSQQPSAASTSPAPPKRMISLSNVKRHTAPAPPTESKELPAKDPCADLPEAENDAIGEKDELTHLHIWHFDWKDDTIVKSSVPESWGPASVHCCEFEYQMWQECDKLRTLYEGLVSKVLHIGRKFSF